MEELIAERNPRRKKRRRGRRGRRNPEMLAIGNPKKKRRGRRRGRSFSFALKARGWRKNPGFGGRIPLLGYPVSSLMYLAVGATGTSFLSGYVVKYVPFLAPTAGATGMFERAKPYVVDVVAAFAVSKLGGMVFKSKQAENEILTGGLSVPLLRLLRQEVFPKIGLSGPDDFNEADFGYFEPVSLPRRGSNLSGWRHEVGRRRMRVGSDLLAN